MDYQLWIEDGAKAEIRLLPGRVRQRIRRAIQRLSDKPRPHNGQLSRGAIARMMISGVSVSVAAGTGVVSRGGPAVSRQKGAAAAATT